MKVLFNVMIWSLLAGCSLLGDKRGNGDGGLSPAESKITAEVSGVAKDMADNIVTHLSVTKKRCAIPATYFETLLARADEEARIAIAAFGYYAPDIEITSEADDACRNVLITVASLGEPVIVNEVDLQISGAAGNDPEFMQTTASLPLKAGEVLNHKAYENTKQALREVAAELGYLDARFDKTRLEVDPKALTATARLHFNSGPRYAFGPISIEQQPDLVSEKLIRRFLRHREGQPYSVDTVSNYTNALLQSGYFNRAEVTPDFNAKADERVPLTALLKPTPRHSFTAGAGLSTDEGLRGRLNYLDRRLNRSGHRISLDGRASFISQSGSAEYRIPRQNPRAEWLALQAGVRRQNIDSFDTVETQLSVTETKLRPFGWLETRYIQLSRQTFGVGAQDDDSLFLIPGLRWNRSEANDELYPTKGWRYSFEIRGGAEHVLSDTSFASATARAKWIYPAPFRARILLRSTIGAMWVNDFFRLPPSERFFTGGDNTIRGYEFEELGPEDDNGDVIGGTYLGLASLEYEQPLYKKFSGALFVDAGNAYGGEGSSDGVKIGVGIGVRWRSPIGPVKFDIAHPVQGSQTVRFHLRIGPDL